MPMDISWKAHNSIGLLGELQAWPESQRRLRPVISYCPPSFTEPIIAATRQLHSLWPESGATAQLSATAHQASL
eukprot:gene10864-16980_t